jgi:hypothetical protein
VGGRRRKASAARRLRARAPRGMASKRGHSDP